MKHDNKQCMFSNVWFFSWTLNIFSHECQEDKCNYLFILDSIVHIDHPDTLIELIRYNRTIVAPMLLRPGKTWSNFWGDYTDEGFYQRSSDYMDFINYNKMSDRI